MRVATVPVTMFSAESDNETSHSSCEGEAPFDNYCAQYVLEPTANVPCGEKHGMDQVEESEISKMC